MTKEQAHGYFASMSPNYKCASPDCPSHKEHNNPWVMAGHIRHYIHLECRYCGYSFTINTDPSQASVAAFTYRPIPEHPEPLRPVPEDF